MKEFILIFRNSTNPHDNPSQEQLQERMNWMGGIAARNRLADKGNRLSAGNAKTIRPGNVVTDGPYTEIKEYISGYMIVKTATIEEAIELARNNPILKDGGNIEVRAILGPEEGDHRP
ncbi:YciI family protein [Chitinophaga solisilvae]|uniref:YciI family protein n=1 Tax=Chitinophaga solisilvae TaxID=1233460 RepID=UPI00136DACEA|nr:YciI family protein [Chitinophaga solisilvae]